MKFYQVVLTVIAAFVINNVLLVNYLNQESVQPQSGDAIPSVPKPGSQIVKDESAQEFESDQIKAEESDQNSHTKLAETATDTDSQQLIETIETYAKSDQFIAILDDYYLTAATRYQEIEQRLNGLNASELFAIVSESDNLLKQQSAMQLLTQGKLHQLSVSELKTLYQHDQTPNWNKANILTSLLNENDPEALGWAKNMISSGSHSRWSGLNDELYTSVYEKDPNFIRNYINEFEIESGPSGFGFYNFMQQEPKLANEFFTTRLDEILDVENGTIFQFGGYDVEFDMTTSQQSKLLSFFESSNQRKRSFAMSLLENVDDIDMLREAFSELERTREKRNFINSIGTSGDSKKQSLAKELARNSGDPSLQKRFR